MTRSKGARPCKSLAWSSQPPFYKACGNYAMENADFCRRHAYMDMEDSLLRDLQKQAQQ